MSRATPFLWGWAIVSFIMLFYYTAKLALWLIGFIIGTIIRYFAYLRLRREAKDMTKQIYRVVRSWGLNPTDNQEARYYYLIGAEIGDMPTDEHESLSLICEWECKSANQGKKNEYWDHCAEA